MEKADIVRAGIINTLLRWETSKLPIDECISRTLQRKAYSSRGRRFFAHIVYGTIRNLDLLDYIISQFFNSTLDTLPRPILYILRIAVFQYYFCSQVTIPAAVHTSVDLAHIFGHAGLARMVNAVLRKLPEKFEDIELPSKETDFLDYLSVRYSIPIWILEEFIKRFGEENVEEFAISVSEIPFMSIRTNTMLITREELEIRLKKIGIEAQHLTPIPEELSLNSTYLLTNCPLMRQGLYTIQDPASMLSVHALNPQPGDIILDICSAPGTKTTHIAQLTKNRSKIFSVEIHPGRIQRIFENIYRLKCENIYPICSSGTFLPFPNETFDRILVDAPCSGLGTLRRNPDIKYTIKKDALKRLPNLQKEILEEASRVCKKGGIIVYSVCTFTEDETLGVVNEFIKEKKLIPINAPEWLDSWKIQTGQYQTLPLKNLWDGFFLTVFQKP
ncbi:MAG: 16S rRNA (cytosine(967)-C(5))-methyltransferase RsmB [Candidatus Hydrogenedens sp.]|nr:16S rRNA (cytosine(967)-C(5))-methyltransferase RsmB [Candidatus Hydrogenedens sp.]